MSRDVITIGLHEPLAKARELLVDHNIRTLPVVDERGLLAGALGLRELAQHGDGSIGRAMSKVRTASTDEPAVALVEPLTNGHMHAVVVTAEDRRILGIITQTDLLAFLIRLVSAKDFELNRA